ncbi:MAG: HipA N-terminal domain-containing protein [Chlamydiia bacterium]|nr:HipA N-terminal domain-containing protein [Chlamydiia bacterium]
MQIPTDKVPSVLVYLERRKSRKFVGELKYNFRKHLYVFVYDKAYLRANLIPLGPELPLSPRKFLSSSLFESFIDRLPSRENPAYQEYCAAENIEVTEQDPFILLTTIGKRGPSSFIFERQKQAFLGAIELKGFRKKLGLTTREFAIGFSIATKTLSSIENGRSDGRDAMKRLELYIRFPEVALFEFRRNCAAIHRDKRKQVEHILSTWPLF